MALFTQTIQRQTLQSAVLKWFAAEEFSFEQENAAPNCAAAMPPTPSTGVSLFGLLDVGAVMGRITIGGGTPGSATANGGNTGNGTCGTVTAQTGEQVGTYTISFTAATAFNVTDPKGVLVGSGATGTAFANQLGFTITAGSTAFVAGDSFTVVVPPGAYTANSGNTGNGTCGAITAKAGVQAGTYYGEFTAATKYNLFDPYGKLVGEGATGTAFNNQLGFTITAGGTAFVAGDGFTIGVAAGSGNVTPLNLSAVDGSAVAMGVVIKAQTVPSNATAVVLVVERMAVLLSDGLIWPAGISGAQQTNALAQLAANHIICRAS
ncbi:MAG: head decoration protein [Beijerinckiaceae bacterium]